MPDLITYLCAPRHAAPPIDEQERQLPQPGKPDLWGFIYRLLQQLFTLTPEESCVT